jgi:hypothetical protein
MSARRLDLLEKLCVLLEGLPPEKFSYATWAEGGVDLHACGTTACALGWATTIPECGLRLDRNEYGYICVTDGGKDSTVHAAARAFGLSIDEAGCLFCPDEESETVGGNSPDEEANASISSAASAASPRRPPSQARAWSTPRTIGSSRCASTG